jgi:hypothetical protein
MAGLVRMDLIERFRDHEDSFVERKPEGGDFKRTIVAFANSVPAEREAILYVGVGDKGEIFGIKNPDSLQKKIRKICLDECYPPIHFTTEILRIDDKPILAVIIPPSSNKPHFSGPAFIRRGNESVSASLDLFNDLITSRNSKCYEILRYKNQIVTIVTQKGKLGRPEFPYIRAGTTMQNETTKHECRVESVTPFSVKFIDIASGRYFTEPLQNIEISYDEEKQRPLLIIKLDSA